MHGTGRVEKSAVFSVKTFDTKVTFCFFKLVE